MAISNGLFWPTYDYGFEFSSNKTIHKAFNTI